MEDKDKDNPFEEIQKELRKILGGSGPVVIPGFGATAPTPKGGDAQDEEKDRKRRKRLDNIRNFRRQPRELVSYLDRYVIGQEDAKKVLSVAVCDHYNHVRRCLDDGNDPFPEYQKQNVLLLGPTGVGKTYLMKNLAKLIGVPFVKADATKFSETGYVGADVEDLVRDLVKAADGDIDLAETGIIYLDEIDKIAGQSTAGGKDVSGRGVQINLLKLMEETEVSQFSQTDLLSQMNAMMAGGMRGGGQTRRMINTRNILFIVSGAFDELGKSIARRIGRGGIGFTADAGEAENDSNQYLPHAETTDFIKYGFEPEFIGRLPVRVAFKPLSISDIGHIITSSEGSILRQYARDFAGYGIELKMDASAVEAIAERAFAEGTGARGIMSVMERVFRDLKYQLPSTSIRTLEIDRAAVEDPARCLSDLLARHPPAASGKIPMEVAEFQSAFAENHGLTLQFSAGAVEILQDLAKQAGENLAAFLESHLHDLPYALKIIARNDGRQVFVIDEACATNPDEEISRWVVQSFRDKEGEGNPQSD